VAGRGHEFPGRHQRWGVGSVSDVIAEEGDAATIDLGCSLRLFDCYFFARIDTFAEKTVSPPDRK
jgi:hypothetical protein